MSEELTPSQDGAQIPSAEVQTNEVTEQVAAEIPNVSPVVPAEEAAPVPPAVNVEQMENLAKPESAAAEQIPVSEPAKVEPKITVQEAKPAPKKEFHKKPVKTDYERKLEWSKNMKTIGHYTDENLINAVTQYALTNRGFNANGRWGSCLIVMMNRLSSRLLNSLRTFTPEDAVHLQDELLRFQSEQPLGDCVVAWNTNFKSNMEQKKAVSNFFGIDKPFRELRGSPAMVMTAFRDAAWPTPEEEKRGTGGSYAERFYYLMYCVMRVCTSSADYAKAMFENSYHTQPTEEFLNRVGGGRNGGRREEADTSWIKDGKCECGGELTKDSQGNTICSMPFCDHHIAKVFTETPRSFRGQRRPMQQQEFPQDFNPEQAPMGAKPQRKNWKDKKRHDRDAEDFQAFRKGGKKHGPRFRVNDSDDDNRHEDVHSEGVTVATAGGDGFRNNAFDNLTLPTVEQEKPDAGCMIPEPSAEVPAV